jgi:uncharacterized protein (TIGR00255 family)
MLDARCPMPHARRDMRSMTGYGRAQAMNEEVSFVVEIQSINKRQSEIILNVPEPFASTEPDLRQIVERRIHRGRVTANVSAKPKSAALQPSLDLVIARAYLLEFQRLQRELSLPGQVTIDTLLRLPGVVVAPQPDLSSASQRDLLIETFTQAVEAMYAMRQTEGEALSRDLIARIKLVEGVLGDVRNLGPRATERYRAQLHERLVKAHIEIGIDDERMAKEIAIFAERSDFSEELTRLLSHLEQFLITSRKEEPIGRTLEFLCQEVGRELNTLGAKANDAEISMLVVQCKAEMEKIREQVQNVE